MYRTMSFAARSATIGSAALAAYAMSNYDRPMPFAPQPAHAAFFSLGENKMQELDRRVAALEVTAGASTNQAFVFVKPHAAGSTAVIDLVKSTFAANGIAVTSEGTYDARTIDEKKYIDTHYGAIASKAVTLKPSELNVPAKGQAEFEKMFGLSWVEALAQGKVYNAKDACAKLGITGEQLDAEWSRLKRGSTMIKFGGGFYCGKVGDIFVMNGFYMSMRGAYCTPPAQIYYMTVEWPTASLSWEDFRGKVLGATNPKEAASGSIRRLIMENWRSLGLRSLPDTGNNGVHASASPFEGLAERANWLGQDISTDLFGRAMLSAGVSADTIKAWFSDPQVSYPEGGRGSLFDALEDMDADEVLRKSQALNKANSQ